MAKTTTPAKLPGPRIVSTGFHERVFAVVSRIPTGFVATYGDVAEALGARSVARQVGFALAALPPRRKDVPWHRVVGAGGRLTLDSAGRQARLLKKEGIGLAKGAARIAEFDLVRVPLALLTSPS
jgi:methylated-DNA-protein-cysteine methyltransferase-like protein